MAREGGGFVRRVVSLWTTSDQEIEAERLAEHSRSRGLPSLAEIPLRTRVTVAGTLRDITLRPRGGVPATEATLYDGSGELTLVWLGRRDILGLFPGVRLTASGLASRHGARIVMYNPEYAILLRD